MRDFQTQSEDAIIAKLEHMVRETVQQTRISEAVVTSKLDQLGISDRQRYEYQRLIDNIGFSTMNAREDYISERVSNSTANAKWIFGELARYDEHKYMSQKEFEAMRARQQTIHTNFIRWLQEGTGIWFIGGKPGSGKSTLMSFVRNALEEGAYASLVAWARATKRAIISFFFFWPEDHLARSFEGLWRSLCYQILVADESLFRQIDELNDAPDSIKHVATSTSSAIRWRVKDLREWCFFLLSHSSLEFVVLIDGLDELQDSGGADEGHADLLRAMKSMASDLANIKLICSARPVEPFKAALASETSFEVQDVNYLDIMTFVNSRLAGTAAAPFIPRVVERSHAVFLWTHIVVNELQKTTEMRDLFTHLLARRDYYYVKNPKPLLSLMMMNARLERSSGGPAALELLFIARAKWDIQNLIASIAQPLSQANWIDIIEHAPEFFSEMLGRGGGLLHVVGSKDPTKSYDRLDKGDVATALRERLMYRGIQFIHRTALDYLDEDENGRSLLSTTEHRERDSCILLALGHMAVLSLQDGPLKKDPFLCAGSWADAHVRALSVVFAQVLRCIDKALCTSEPAHTDRAITVCDMFFRRLAERTASDEFPVWCSDIRGMLVASNDLFTSENVSRDVQYAIVAAQEQLGTTNLARAYLVNKIRSLPEAQRQNATALAFLNVRNETMWQVLKHTSPFHIPGLYQTSPFSPDPSNNSLCYHKSPLWLHHASYRHFELFQLDRTRKYAVHVLDMLINGSVGEGWQCTRFLVCAGNRSVSVVPWIPQDATLQILYPFNDQWHMSSMVSDLPRTIPWVMSLETSMRAFRPGGSWTWIMVKDIADDLLLHMTTDTTGLARLTFNQLYTQICVSLVNTNLENLRADLKNMVGIGWGFHQGRACHHFSEDTCSTCDFDDKELDNESREKFMEQVERDLQSRHMLCASDFRPDSSALCECGKRHPDHVTLTAQSLYSPKHSPRRSEPAAKSQTEMISPTCSTHHVIGGVPRGHYVSRLN